MESPQDLQKTLGLFQLLAFGVAGVLGASWIYTSSALFAEYGAAGVRWHTPTGLGLAVFGNRTYFPAEDVAESVRDDMVREIGYQPRDPREKATIYTVFEGPTATVEGNLTGFLKLTERWDEQLARKIFSSNVFQDYTQADLKQRVASLKQHRLTVDAWLSRTEAILGSPGQRDRLQVLFNPLGQIQKFTWG